VGGWGGWGMTVGKGRLLTFIMEKGG
jgi:hypothetical protein